ncbi:hypothetical protein G8C15_17140 [Enterococcus casseliflavus]|nr:hypothetical protein [Enterococcus casseliflavus]MBF0014408.1 hypothetical protein [Enterococcus casseliflavus]
MNPDEISISKVTGWNFGTIENYDPSVGASMVAARAENNTFHHIIIDYKREGFGSWSLSVSRDSFRSLNANNYHYNALFSRPSSLQLLEDNESVEV